MELTPVWSGTVRTTAPYRSSWSGDLATYPIGYPSPPPPRRRLSIMARPISLNGTPLPIATEGVQFSATRNLNGRMRSVTGCMPGSPIPLPYGQDLRSTLSLKRWKRGSGSPGQFRTFANTVNLNPRYCDENQPRASTLSLVSCLLRPSSPMTMTVVMEPSSSLTLRAAESTAIESPRALRTAAAGASAATYVYPKLWWGTCRAIYGRIPLPLSLSTNGRPIPNVGLSVRVIEGHADE